MEHPFVYIIRGLPSPLDRNITQALVGYLEMRLTSDISNMTMLIRSLDAASNLMVPLPEYDLSDFNRTDVIAALDRLADADEELWAQLLDALNDSRSPDYRRLKELSPFNGKLLAFYDIAHDISDLKLDLDDDLAGEILRRADVHDFPGNSGMVVVSPEALDQMSFLDCVDNVPATA